MADEQTVVTTTRTFLEEVEAADKTPEDKTVYIWSNGKKYVDKDDPYAEQ